MIPYAELEQAINRWKSRKSGDAPAAAPAAPTAPVATPSPELMAGPPDEETPVEAEIPAQEPTGEIALGDDVLLEEDQ